MSGPDWDAARLAGCYAPESLVSEGFVHLSYRGQVASVANQLYHDRLDLVVVELDSTRLPRDLVVEDSYGTGQSFPHLYAAVPTAAEVAVHDLPRDADGRFYFPG